MNLAHRRDTNLPFLRLHSTNRREEILVLADGPQLLSLFEPNLQLSSQFTEEQCPQHIH